MKQIFRRKKPPLKIMAPGDQKTFYTSTGPLPVSESNIIRKPTREEERAARGEVYRYGNLIHVEPGKKFDIKKTGGLIFRCFVCRQLFDEVMAEEHLKKCQPDGAVCGSCGKKFLPHLFIDHYKKCLASKVRAVKAG